MSKREAFIFTDNLDWSKEFTDWHFNSIDGRDIYIDGRNENASGFRTGQLVILEQTVVPVRGQEHVKESLGTYWKLIDEAEPIVNGSEHGSES